MAGEESKLNVAERIYRKRNLRPAISIKVYIGIYSYKPTESNRGNSQTVGRGIQLNHRESNDQIPGSAHLASSFGRGPGYST